MYTYPVYKSLSYEYISCIHIHTYPVYISLIYVYISVYICKRRLINYVYISLIYVYISLILCVHILNLIMYTDADA